MGFTASVFIGTSLDGYIARPDGDVEWLTAPAEAAESGDMGYHAFMAGVDTLAMGRNTYEKVLSFGEEAWPYGDVDVAVVSTTLPPDADPRVTVYRSLAELVAGLEERGAKHVYVDGGRLIQSFLRAGLVGRITVTTAPVLIGSGHRLFGELDGDVRLRHEETVTYKGGYVQTTWAVEG